MWQIIFRLIATLIVLLGVVLVFDARIITKKMFKNFGDTNEASNGFKILGALICMIGGVILFFTKI